MVYHPPPPSEPNGCLQTLVISRMIFQILMIPMLLIIGVLFAVILLFYAYSQHPVFGLLVFGAIGLVFYGFMKWENRRIDREHPPERDR